MGPAVADLGLWAHPHEGWARPESELSPQLHRGSRCTATAVLGPDLGVFVSVSW